MLLVLPSLLFGWGSGISDQIEDAIDAFEGGFIEKVLVGHLEDGEEVSWSLGLGRRDDYWFVAVCDYDCDDIDLCVENECDTTSEDTALVYLDNVSNVDIEVDMFDCDEAYCYYAVVIIRD